MATIKIDKTKFDSLTPEQIKEIKKTVSKILNESVEVVGVDFSTEKKTHKSKLDFNEN